MQKVRTKTGTETGTHRKRNARLEGHLRKTVRRAGSARRISRAIPTGMLAGGHLLTLPTLAEKARALTSHTDKLLKLMPTGIVATCSGVV